MAGGPSTTETNRRDSIVALRRLNGRLPTPATGLAHKGTVASGSASVELGQAVAAGKPHLVSLYVGGARQAPGVDFTTDGSDHATLTWVPDAALDTLAIHDHPT